MRTSLDIADIADKDGAGSRWTCAARISNTLPASRKCHRPSPRRQNDDRPATTSPSHTRSGPRNRHCRRVRPANGRQLVVSGLC